MKWFVFCLVVAFILGGGALSWSLLAAPPPEGVELDTPTSSPDQIASGTPTFVTFTATLPDESIKSPRLQFFDSTKGKWKTIKALSDQGRWEDPTKGDREFNLRLHLLDSGGTTQLGLPTRAGIKVKAEQSSPAQLRLVAKKKGQAGVVVSPVFSVRTSIPTPITIRADDSTSPASVEIPPTFEILDNTDPSWVVLTRPGPDGYDIVIRTIPNPAGLTLEQVIIACFLLPRAGPCQILQSGDPQTLSEYDFAKRLESVEIVPLTVSGLSGIQLHLEDPSSRSYEVFLNDPAQQRAFHFSIFENDRQLQGPFFTSSLDEALRIVESLQP